MIRDHTARTRVRSFLARSGPLHEPSGYATTALRDAIAYEGSNVGFIQLLAAMEDAGELSRDIRGKRTYAITASASTLAAFGDAQDSTDTVGAAALAGYPGCVFDSGRLTRALVRAACAALADRSARPSGDDDYARRLMAASDRIDSLLADLKDPDSALR